VIVEQLCVSFFVHLENLTLAGSMENPHVPSFLSAWRT
jgi:hypothetical protein